MVPEPEAAMTGASFELVDATSDAAVDESTTKSDELKDRCLLVTYLKHFISLLSSPFFDV